MTVHSEEYNNNAKLKRTNMLIQTDDNCFGVIKTLIVCRYCTCEKPCECSNFPIIIFQICKATKPMPKYSQHIHQLSSDYATNVKAMFPDKLYKKCVQLSYQSDRNVFYAIPLANHLETD